jgi:hypothetical protein
MCARAGRVCGVHVGVCGGGVKLGGRENVGWEGRGASSRVGGEGGIVTDEKR